MSDLADKILVVDDEQQIRKLLSLTLSEKGFKVFEAFNGQEAIAMTQSQKFQLILLDIGLPDISGMDVLKKIRTWSQIPVIVLSVMNDSEVIIEALNSGADDYVTKPFEAGELLARIKVCLRRVLKTDHNASIFESGNLKVDLESRLVFKNDVEVKLTSLEYDLLKLFLKNQNKVLTTRQILKEVWGPSSIEQAQYPRVYVRHLRQKLEDNPERPTFIITEAGVGYRFKTKA